MGVSEVVSTSDVAPGILQHSAMTTDRLVEDIGRSEINLISNGSK